MRGTSTIGMTYDDLKREAMALPEVEESSSYGTPALKVRGKLMVRLKEDLETIVLRTTWEDRETADDAVSGNVPRHRPLPGVSVGSCAPACDAACVCLEVAGAGMATGRAQSRWSAHFVRHAIDAWHALQSLRLFLGTGKPRKRLSSRRTK